MLRVLQTKYTRQSNFRKKIGLLYFEYAYRFIMIMASPAAAAGNRSEVSFKVFLIRHTQKKTSWLGCVCMYINYYQEVNVTNSEFVPYIKHTKYKNWY